MTFSPLRQLVNEMRTAFRRGRPSTARRGGPRSCRLRLEHLEERQAPAVLTVTTLLDNVAGSLRAQVALAQDGDTVRFAEGLRGQVTLTGVPIDVNHSIGIAGPGLDTIAVSGNHSSRIFNVPAGQTVSISGLTIVNGRATDQGGAIDNRGTLTVSGCMLTGNSAAGNFGGGAIYNAGTLTVRASTLANDSAPYGGGIYNDAGMLTLSGSTLAGNFATQFNGGAIFIGAGTVTISDSTLAGNWCINTVGGGAIYNAGMLTITDSALSSNSVAGFLASASRAGGAIFNTGTLVISGSSLTNNTAFRAGGIYNGGNASLIISDSTVAGNSADISGHGLGGGIYNNGSLSINNTTISGNSSDQDGGGIWNQSGTMAITGSTFVGNTAVWGGGGITISWNSSVTISDTTVAGNSAGLEGGGITYDENQPGHLATFTNVTVTGNRDNTRGGSLTGGGLAVTSGSVLPPVLHNTLIAGNFNGATGANRDDVSGRVAGSSDYNLIGDSNHMSGISNGVNGNQVGTHTNPIDARLSLLGYHGGPTQTVPLLAGSPALNAGSPDQLGTPDQRGVIRSGGANIGAYQASATAFILAAPATVTAGVPFGVTVTAEDPFMQTAVGYTGTVHFGSTDGQALLPGDYTFTGGDAGQHTFTGAVTLETAGNQIITATDTGSISGSGTVTVTPAAADHLLFLQQPTDTAAGQTISPAVMVAVVDQFGNIVTSDNIDTVTLSIGVDPSGGTATLGGTLTVTVVHGVATFDDLSINQPGAGYTLHATVGGALPDVDSGPFSVTM
jgi:hypothetical protein